MMPNAEEKPIDENGFVPSKFSLSRFRNSSFAKNVFLVFNTLWIVVVAIKCIKYFHLFGN